jgi:hypothetical protein
MLHKFEPGKDRWKLGFKEAVLKNFAFLVSNGFKAVRQDVTFVRYESQVAFVNIYHGRGSFEVGVEIGRLDRRKTMGSVTSFSGRAKRRGTRKVLGARQCSR